MKLYQMKEILFELAGKQIGVLGGDACRVSDNLNENTFILLQFR